jgi:hypothetical protein
MNTDTSFMMAQIMNGASTIANTVGASSDDVHDTPASEGGA